jgi:hypothetical protein
MRKYKSPSFVYDALFVIIVMAAAMAAAVLETSAVLGGWLSIDAAPTASSTPPSADPPAVSGSLVDGALLSVAVPNAAR